MSKAKEVINDEAFWSDEIGKDIDFILKLGGQSGIANARTMEPIKKIARKLIESINKNADSADRLARRLIILTSAIVLTAVLQVILIFRGK